MSTSASELAQRLAREAEAVCRHYLSNGRREGRYWLVGDVRNMPGRSLFVRLKGGDSGPGAIGKWTDAATGEHGDLLDIIQESCGLTDFREVAAEARRFLAMPEAPSDGQTRQQSPLGSRDSATSARRLFAMSRPIAGTIAETYLHQRGIAYLDDAEANRVAQEPAHRPPGRVDRGLVVAQDVMAAGEGIETMLSLRCVMPNLPMAAALSAAHLAALRLPDALRRLYVAHDNDPAGESAAVLLAERALKAGIEAIVLSPQLGDFNEDLLALELDAPRQALRVQVAPEDAPALRI